ASFVEDNFSTDGWLQIHIARPPLTSSCAAQFLTRHGPIPVYSPGVGGPLL
uniref:Uncharacterized protein n=1 Tax=Naja naja TaxID=35670 RepID=A0A8C7DUL7_NAJNA